MGGLHFKEKEVSKVELRMGSPPGERVSRGGFFYGPQKDLDKTFNWQYNS